MNSTHAISVTSATPPTPSLEDVITRLSRYGRPSVMMLSARGWHCDVRLNTDALGTCSSVQSEFGLRTPLEAAVQCEERLIAAMKGRV